MPLSIWNNVFKRPQHISIIGYGRFGKLWASILQPEFKVSIVDKASTEDAKAQGLQVTTSEEALAADVIFYCVPISAFAETLSEHAKILKSKEYKGDKLFVDLLSVKVHAKNCFAKHFSALASDSLQIMLAHPMFGPDSVAQNGLAGQRIMLEQYTTENSMFHFWKDYFASKALQIIEMTAEEHDKQAASSQALTHLVGRILEKMEIMNSQIDTNNSIKLQEISKQVSQDELQLFLDLQRYNPYTAAMRQNFAAAQAEVFRLIEDS